MLKPKASSRSLYMEIDHPMMSSDPESVQAKRRAITVAVKNCGALISNIYIDSNEIIGDVETLSSFLGPDLYKLIMYDKADIGTSLRMFGRTQIEESTGLTHIIRPIRPITYDIVSNPSHSTARIIDIITEGGSLIQAVTNSNLITEDIEDIQQQLCIDGMCFPSINEDLYTYLEQIISTQFKKLGPVMFNV